MSQGNSLHVVAVMLGAATIVAVIVLAVLIYRYVLPAL